MKKNIKNIFLRNWGLKLFSFFLALILWIILIPREKIFSERTLTIPLEVFNIPPNMELVKKPPSNIDVTIRAPQRVVSQINTSQLYAILNLENAQVRRENYRLDSSMISIPLGAEIKDFSPSQVHLRLELKKEKNMKVEPDIVGELKKGFQTEKIEVLPSQLLVKGPESKIKDYSVIKTYPLDISSLTKTTEIETDIILPDPDLNLVYPDTQVKVRITIKKNNSVNKKKKEPK